jgi:hypothetical protein
MRERIRTCAVIALGPFAQTVAEALPLGAFSGPVVHLRAPAPGLRRHAWMPEALRTASAADLDRSRPGAREGLLASASGVLESNDSALRALSDGPRPTLILLAGLFDPEAVALLDLAARVRARRPELEIVALVALTPPAVDQDGRARAGLALHEIAAAFAGGRWELPDPSGVLTATQVGTELDACLLAWPDGPRWSGVQAASALRDDLAAVPFIQTLGRGLGGLRVVPVRAPSQAVRERLADHLAADALERWVAPGGSEPDLAAVERRIFDGLDRSGTSWLVSLAKRADGLVTEAAELAATDPTAANDLVRGRVPELERELRAEIGAGGKLRNAAEGSRAAWYVTARDRAEEAAGAALTGAGGFFRLVELAQAAPERLAALVETREADATATNVKAALADREAATETLRKAIDKPAGLRLRLLGKQAEQLLTPLKAWRDAIIDHASELDRQATLWAEARLIERLRSDAERAALALQVFEISLREQLSSLRQPTVGANAIPTSGVVVLPGGAVDANDAAASVAQSVDPTDPGLDAVELSSLTGSAEPLIATVRARLRQRLGSAEQSLTLAGALASLPATGPGRAAIDAARSRINIPLLGPRAAAGTELVIAALPADVDPKTLGLPNDVTVVQSGWLEDGLLMRLVADVPVEGLGLRKSALDEAVARLEQRRPNAPDLLWRRFPPA